MSFPLDNVLLSCAGINIFENVTQMACKGSDESTTDGSASKSESWRNLCPIPMNYTIKINKWEITPGGCWYVSLSFTLKLNHQQPIVLISAIMSFWLAMQTQTG